MQPKKKKNTFYDIKELFLIFKYSVFAKKYNLKVFSLIPKLFSYITHLELERIGFRVDCLMWYFQSIALETQVY